MISDIEITLENRGKLRAHVAVTINGSRFDGLDLYEDRSGDVKLFLPYNSKISSGQRHELKERVLQEYKKMTNSYK